MPEWTHHICAQCWYENMRDDPPHRLADDTEWLCCFCATRTTAGIYIRSDPEDLPCLGLHYLPGGP